VSLTGAVVDFIVETDFNDLPKERWKRPRKLFIDTAGVALAGQAPRGRGNTQSAAELGGDRRVRSGFSETSCPPCTPLDHCMRPMPLTRRVPRRSAYPFACSRSSDCSCDAEVMNGDGRDLITAMVSGRGCIQTGIEHH